MDEGWRDAILSDVVRLQRGHDLPTPTRRPGQVPVVGSFGVTGWHDEAKADAPGVTIGRSGASIGTAVFVSKPYWPLNTCLYVTDFRGNDARWVFHLLDLIDFAGYNSGSAQPSLNRNFLAQIPVRVPDTPTQRRIAAVIGALNECIESNQRLATRMEAQARLVASSAPVDVPLREVAVSVVGRQVMPLGTAEHYSLPAFDDGQIPELVDGSSIKSGKQVLNRPVVLVSRLNPKWERCWMAYPGDNAVASTEFVPLVGRCVDTEGIWAMTSGTPFWEQMRAQVTGTTGSHQRVDKSALLDLSVPDVRRLDQATRQAITTAVQAGRALRVEALDLTRTRDELLPLLMSGRIRVADVEGAL